ncbi:putative assembly protein [Leclercia adecarboxylata]|uniref:Putative assembly protein n=1 Tax=Leclercia adecarboxylata TaxID=83655 RepID=A0A4U9I532_9ENTR|nr:putative assembly protein [Leclercia adecarboxylata]
MRRVLTTLMILLVVLVAGLSALVLLVNPNDFRTYMVRQVEARSGYTLKLEGPPALARLATAQHPVRAHVAYRTGGFCAAGCRR